MMDDSMTNQIQRHHIQWLAREKYAASVKDAARGAFSTASDMARDTGSKAKQTASDRVSSVNEHVLETLDKQIVNS